MENLSNASLYLLKDMKANELKYKILTHKKFYFAILPLSLHKFS